MTLKTVLIDLCSSLSESAIDSIMEEGILRDIPLLGSAVGVARASKAVRDALFIRKIQAFLESFDDVSNEDKERMRNRINEEEQRDRLGEKLVFVLERADELEKARLIAKCFILYCEQNLEVEELFRVWSALDKVLIDDLQYLLDFEREQTCEHGFEWDFLSAGLLQSRIAYLRDELRDPEFEETRMAFSLSYSGELLLRVLKRKSNREKSCT